MIRLTPLFLALTLAGSGPVWGQPVLRSPGGGVVATLRDDGGRLTLAVTYGKQPLLTPSRLGLVADGLDFSTGISLRKIAADSVDVTWQAINEKTPTVRNHYRQYGFVLTKAGAKNLTCRLTFRLYDDGLAYRYELTKPGTDSIALTGEVSQFQFAHDFTYWAYNGEHPNVGPLRRSMARRDTVRTPLVIRTQTGPYVAIHEAAVLTAAPFDLRTTGSGFSVGFRPDTGRYAGRLLTSWRTFIIGERPGNLVESNLLVNLNEPNRINDPSWIRPGKSVWDWRVAGYRAADGFVYGLNTASHKRLIDFAARNNIQYLLMDADWYGAEFSATSDPTTARDGVDIQDCMAYAKTRNVGVILYLNDVGAKKFGLERVLKHFADWGAVGVKYGFMRGTDRQKVAQTRRVVELCAHYHLMVDFHDDPIKPSGDRRTWPNLVAREYGHAQADGRRSYWPETAVSSAFINQIAGPIDYTNGWFDLNGAQSRDKVFAEIPGTVAAEVAKLIVAYTGWMVLPDSPEEYQKKADLFACIRNMPPQFDDFRVLDGAIDDFIVVARRAGESWFVGSLTNRQPRELTIDLHFLPKNKRYRATLYEDTEATHFLTNKESYRIRTQPVDAATTLRINLAPGGGNAIYLEPINRN